MSRAENALIRAEEVVARCRSLATFSEDRGSTRRTFLSPPMRDCHKEIGGWLKAVGGQVTVDAVGNLRGFYPGAQSSAPRLLIGSHLDTIPNAGAYDGILGVVIAVALLEALEGRRLSFGIEVIGFSEEEGVRFGIPFLGSRALVGRLDEEVLDNNQDAGGISIRTAIENYGLNPAEINRASLSNDALAYLEFHIEQGPVLESLGRPLGAVASIAAQTRLELLFTGSANHAGTTPMHLRHDALAAAAEWIVDVERFARSEPGLIATVGQIEAKPGAINVIAGKARVSLDVRHRSDEGCVLAAQHSVSMAEGIGERREVKVRWRELLKQPAVAMNEFLVGQIAEAMQKAGCAAYPIVSGAGHDAMILAEKIPAAMIFLRTPGGISHDPAESVLVEDVAKALECGLHLMEQLTNTSDLQKRMGRA